MIDLKVTLIYLALIAALTQGRARPHFIDCQTDSDCASPTTCCVISQQRFAIPRCSHHTGEGEPCRPSNAPFNTTLHYLSGDSVDFVNVWRDMCPCSFGLECSSQTGTCEVPLFTINNLVDEGETLWEED